MASCVTNFRTKNYQNLVIGFQVTVKNVGDAFLGHSCSISFDDLHFLKIVNDCNVLLGTFSQTTDDSH